MKKLGVEKASQHLFVLNGLRGRLGIVVNGMSLRNLPDSSDGLVLETVNVGEHITFSGRRIRNGPDHLDLSEISPPISISSASWYEVIVTSKTGWVLGQDIVLEKHSFNPDVFDHPDYLWKSFHETLPTDAFVSSPTLCYADRELQKPIEPALATGENIRVLKRVYIRELHFGQTDKPVPGDDIYFASCRGRNAYISGRDLVLMGGQRDHIFSENTFVLANPSGVWFYGPSGNHVRDYQMWLVRLGPEKKVTRLECDPACRDFSSSPSGEWLWACGSFYTDKARRQCAPSGKLGQITWLDNNRALMRAVEEASVYLVDVRKCAVTRAVDLSTIIPMDECDDCTCQAVPWPAARVDQATGRVYFEAEGQTKVTNQYKPLVPWPPANADRYQPITISSSIPIGQLQR